MCGSISRWGNYGGSRSVIATIKERWWWWWCQVASGKMAPEAAPSPLVPLESSPLSQVVTRCSHSAAPAHADHNHQLNSYCNILWNHQTNLSQNMSIRYLVKASSFYKSCIIPIGIHSYPSFLPCSLKMCWSQWFCKPFYLFDFPLNAEVELSIGWLVLSCKDANCKF